MSQRGRFVFQSEVTGMAEPGHFQGVATSTHLTRDGKWQFSEQAIAGMAQQGSVPLSSDILHPEATVSRGHVIGMVTKWQLSADGKTLLYEGEINPKLPPDLYAWYCSWFDTTDPFYVPIKVSVGGFVPNGSVRTVRLAGQAGTTEFVDAIKLDHVLLCRADSALNPEATIEPGSTALRAATGDWQDCIFLAAAEALVATDVPSEVADSDNIYEELGQALPPSLSGQATAGGNDMAADMSEDTMKQTFLGWFKELLGLSEVPLETAAAPAALPEPLNATVTVSLTEERVGEIVAQALDTKLSALEEKLTALVGQMTPPAAAPAEEPPAEVPPAEVAQAAAVEVPPADDTMPPAAEDETVPVAQAELPFEVTPAALDVPVLTAEDVGQLGQALENIGQRLTAIQGGQSAFDERLKAQEMRGQARPVSNQLSRAAEAPEEVAPAPARPKVFSEIMEQIKAQVA